MVEEYELEYKEIDPKAIARSCGRAKWSLVLMAVFCFAWAVFTFFTAPIGGQGLFMITPTNGPAGLVPLLSWCGVVMGAVTLLATFLSRPTWVIGWLEPVMGAIMLVWGLYGIFFPTSLGDFATTYSIAGIFLALYVFFIALEMWRKDEGQWLVELAVAGVVWVVSFVGLMKVGGPETQLAVAALALFVAAWGFVYGAVALAGVAPERGANPIARATKDAVA